MIQFIASGQSGGFLLSTCYTHIPGLNLDKVSICSIMGLEYRRTTTMAQVGYSINNTLVIKKNPKLLLRAF